MNNVVEKFKKGSKIHIKESQKGSFTRWCGGNVTSECIQRGKNSNNPKIRKKATFAANARKWKHEKGGKIKKAQYGIPLNLSSEDIQGGLQYIAQGLGKVWDIMNAGNVQPPTTAYLPNGSQIEIPGTQIGIVNDSFGKGGGGKKVGKKLLQSVAKSKDKGLTVTKKVDSSVRHGLVNVDQDLRHFGRGNRRMDPEKLIKEMDKHVEFKEFAKRLSKRLGNLNKDNPQAMKDFKALKNKYEDMLNDFLHNGIKKGQLGMALTQFNYPENPNAVGGDIVNSYIRNQLMIPYLQAQKEEYEKWKLKMKQQSNTQKSSLFDNLLNTGLSIGTDYLKSKLGI